MSAFLKKNIYSTSNKISVVLYAIYLYIYLPITLLWIFITQCFDPSYICVSKRFSLTKQKARYKKLMDEMGKNGFKRNFGEKDFKERGIQDTLLKAKIF